MEDRTKPEKKQNNQDETAQKPEGFLRRMISRFRNNQPKKNFKEIVINVEPLETRVAVLENGILEEYNIERANQERLVGSFFKGRIKNLESSLKAAFVDIDYEKNAFLHYWDILPSSLDAGVEPIMEPGRERQRPRITTRDIPTLYPPGTEIVVQVTKGPIGTKGPRVTTNLSLPGRYLVLLPNSTESGVSRKIENDAERARLKRIVRELKLPNGMGVIVRTAGEDQKQRYFIRDLHILLDFWKEIANKIKALPTPSCVYREPDLIGRTVRDFLTEDVDRIVVDHVAQFERIRDMVSAISRRSRNKVKLYDEDTPIFEKFNVEKQIEQAFRHQVWLPSGGYIVIDETEAMVAIDVNTGRHKPGREQQETISRTNLEAADEICRQLRLRNIGGLLILDFIDMRHPRDQQEVFHRMRERLKRDRAKTHILPISLLGLMEMTRQRQTESMAAAVYEECPYCKGRGMVKSALSLSVEIQRKIREVLRRHMPAGTASESALGLRIFVHPDVLTRLRSEDERLLVDLEKKYSGKLSFRPDPSFHHEQFKIVNAASGEELT